MEWKSLAEKALEARSLAYAPYSGFAVGAALLCSDGTVYQGGNIENGAYTPSNCAERTAFFAAIREGHRSFSAIAIAGAPASRQVPDRLCPPCGVCLQVMAEFCDPDRFRILLVKNREEYESHLLGEMLPFGFRLNPEE